jgi:hypothetical protein
VVRHDVEQQAHTVRTQLTRQFLILLLRTELGVDFARIRYVVRVRAAAPGLETRRRVQVGDAEVVEIRDQVAAIHKTERETELYAVRRERQSKIWHGGSRNTDGKTYAERAEALDPGVRDTVAGSRAVPRARIDRLHEPIEQILDAPQDHLEGE